MPVTNGVGHSGISLIKQDRLRSFLAQQMNVVLNVWAKYRWANPPYYFVDLNAGPGVIPGSNLNGSPLVFLQTAETVGIEHFGYFIEREPENVRTLAGRIGLESERHKILCGDNKGIIFGGEIDVPRNAFGLFYHDPNGIPDFELLAECARQPRADILVRLTAAGMKRNGRRIYDELKLIAKKHWMVQELAYGDRWQWTFLFGSNTNRINEWRSQGWHYTDNLRGRLILQKLNYTNEELDEMWQPDLFAGGSAA